SAEPARDAVGSVRPIVTLRGITKSFALGAGRELQVLDVPELEVSAACCTVLTGRSGSGNTTLLNVIARVSAPTTGPVHVAARDTGALWAELGDGFRAGQVGAVFQPLSPLAAFTALENAMLAMPFPRAVSRRQQGERPREPLTRLGLGDRLHHRPAQLS